MLTHVDISGFRGIRTGALADLRALTVITGGNGAGKSTVLDAAFVASHPDPALAIHLLVTGGRVQGAARYLAPSREPKTTIKLRARTAHETRAVALAIRDNAGGHRVDVQVRNAENTASGALSAEGEVAWKTEPPAILTAVHRIVPAGDLAQAWSDATLAGRSAEVIDRVRRVVPTLDDLQMVLDAGGQPTMYALTRDADVPLELLGAGVVAFVRLCLAALAAPKGLHLIDEPARHAHPSTQWEIARLLWDRVAEGNQVIIATQSLDLVDGIVARASRTQNESLSLRRVALDQGALAVSALDGDDIAFARNVVEDDLR